MSEKLLQVDFNDKNKGLRFLELSTNVNDYDTGKPSKKMIDVDPEMEVKTGNKYRP